VLELRQAFDWLSGGRLVAADPGEPPLRLTGVSTDTRAVRPGELFVALRGERHDAHDFLGQALEAGAAALMVERWAPGCRAPALWVEDTRRGLGEIAIGWRRRFELPVIAVTGSNGKTTVKEMIACVLAAHVGEAARLATRGNLNNEVGVPLTVLRLEASHRAAVIELGMNRPAVLGSIEATARENGEAISALPPDGIAVYPGDDPCAPLWRRLAAGRRTLTFGTDPSCTVHAAPGSRPDGFQMSLDGAPLAVSVAIDGAHNVRNALAAAACCHAIGVPAATIAAGLATFRPASGRLRRLTAASGAAVIDDSYNANPDSVRAAIDVLAQRAAPRVLVLGDMAEVGDEGPAFHAEVGLERLLAFGPASAASADAFGDGAEHLPTIEDVCWRATRLASPQASVLVKGSRSMRMERVVQALVGEAAGHGGDH
jgi:UDP-N-acetylmuramoyl-tripeptide--D-alanyl-D-alanine ligase